MKIGDLLYHKTSKTLFSINRYWPDAGYIEAIKAHDPEDIWYFNLREVERICIVIDANNPTAKVLYGKE